MDVDLLNANYTTTDFVIMLVVALSAVMSFSRGLIREVFSILTLLGGALCASLALMHFPDGVGTLTPANWPSWTDTGILIVSGFLLGVMVCGWLGRQLGGIIHSVPELGLVDRAGGAVFGAGRGLLIAVLLLLGVQQALNPNLMPNFITQAMLYPPLNQAANWTGARLPGLYEQAKTVVPQISKVPASFNNTIDGAVNTTLNNSINDKISEASKDDAAKTVKESIDETIEEIKAGEFPEIEIPELPDLSDLLDLDKEPKE